MPYPCKDKISSILAGLPPFPSTASTVEFSLRSMKRCWNLEFEELKIVLGSSNQSFTKVLLLQIQGKPKRARRCHDIEQTLDSIFERENYSRQKQVLNPEINRRGDCLTS